MKVESIPGQKYFDAPDRDVRLDDIGDAITAKIGITQKPVVLKKSIVLKNKSSHPELSAEDSKKILESTLYHPHLLINDKPQSKPDYWLFVHQGDEKSRSALVELNTRKEQYEIVNWHYLSNDSLERKKKRAKREGGQVLITSPK